MDWVRIRLLKVYGLGPNIVCTALYLTLKILAYNTKKKKYNNNENSLWALTFNQTQGKENAKDKYQLKKHVKQILAFREVTTSCK